jgi:3,4-dehydroadipyl-CoA semialdehyde dehydrogenase
MADVKLESYLAGRWQAGSGTGTTLVDPTDGTAVATASSDGLDLAAGLEHARRVGGPSLRALSYADRAALLGKIADALTAKRDEWYEIARRNSGNTKNDGAIDIEGAIGTLKFIGREGAKLGAATLLVDGPETRLAKDPNFLGRHVGVPVKGVAVHINAFNFPAWGLWGKAGMALLAGVPVLAKPATATAWLAEAMVRAVIDANILPPGSLSLLSGSPRDLLDHLRLGDVVAFTGSAETGTAILENATVRKHGVRVNIEADSLNAALLGPDAAPGTPAFDFFVKEVAKEMGTKAGQKCTAIRRVLVPSDRSAAIVEALSARLGTLKVGNPANEAVRMGPVVNMVQRRAIEDGIKALSAEADIVFRPDGFAPIDADAERGAFVPPTLLLDKQGTSKLVNDIEVFGPVATVVPYGTEADGFDLARRGGGSLVASVFSADGDFLVKAASALGDSHGRLLLVDPSVAESQTGHGIVMPNCLHGGPGRAGDGAELGGLRGLWFYHQRTAIQGAGTTLAAIVAHGVDPASA